MVEFRTGRIRRRAVFLLLGLLLPGIFTAQTRTVVFGPKEYVQTAGKPTAVQNTFRVDQPSAAFALRITNKGVTSAIIQLNGTTILDPDAFVDAAVKDLVRPVVLRAGQNEISVELRGKPGTSLVIEISADTVNRPPVAVISP